MRHISRLQLLVHPVNRRTRMSHIAHRLLLPHTGPRQPKHAAYNAETATLGLTAEQVGVF